MISQYHQANAIYPVSLSLRIKKASESKHFYTQLLGFSIVEETDDHIYYTINGKDIILKT